MSLLNVRSYAKLNLYLRVLSKRRDNYHNLETLFERISLFDEIVLKSRKDCAIRITCSDPYVPRGQKNLAYQAALLLKNKLKLNKGIEIKIKKRIPVASGLGGGSSNAASVLLGLNRLWKLELNQKKLIKYGKMLGSDIPFFITRTSFAIGRGRGDIIREAPVKDRYWQVLAVPDLKKSSTRDVYEQLDRIRAKSSKLTNPKFGVKILLLGLKKKDPSLIKQAFLNDLESAALRLSPRLKDTKLKLSKALGVHLTDISMSGSGPAMFVLVSSRKEGKGLCRQLSRFKGLKTFLVRTI